MGNMLKAVKGLLKMIQIVQMVQMCIYLGIFVNVSLVLVFLSLGKTLTSYKFYYLVDF